MKGQSRPQPASTAGATYTGRSWARARQAMRCLPFRHGFYARVREQPLGSRELCALAEAASLYRGPLTPERAESHFRWLIQLGVLRREVDGQGLTERVRLTPMGRDLLAGWPAEIPPASLLSRLQHQLRRSRPRL